MDTTTNGARTAAAGILEREITESLALAQLLESEYVALSEQDLDRIAETASGKSDSVERLNAIEAERIALLEASGFSANDWPAFLEWCDEDAALERSWQELTALAGRCNTQNLSNGAVIRIRRQQLDDGLAVLRGIDPSAPTYSRSGNNRDGSGNRTIAEA